LFFALSVYGYIAYKLLEYRQLYTKFKINFDFKTTNLAILFIVVVLMFLNWTTEAIKWKILIDNIEKLSIKKSIKSILAGLSFAIITPNRVGEFVGRPVLLKKENRVSGGLATFVGSLSQTITTLGLGLFALILFFNPTSGFNSSMLASYKINSSKFISREFAPSLLINSSNQILTNNQYYLLVLFSVFLFFTFIILFFNPKIWTYFSAKIPFLKKYNSKFSFLNNHTSLILLKVLNLSILRYIVFFTQFYLLLHFFGIDISIQNAFIGIALTYLFLFAIPSFALAEIGIRVSLAVFFIGFFSPNKLAILMASISLWIINLAIPAIIGSFYVMKISKKKTES